MPGPLPPPVVPFDEPFPPPVTAPVSVPVPLLPPFPPELQSAFALQFADAAAEGLMADPPHALADNMSAVTTAIQARRCPRFVLAMG